MEHQRPALSVVVIGRNEGARLQRCLESVQSLQGVAGRVELIYVDSNSTDDSVATARQFGAKVIPLRYERTTAALGRNTGWRAAHADYVMFLDGDTVLHPDFIADAMTHFCDPKVAVVWGERREMKPGESVYNRVLDLDWVFPAGEAEYCGGDALVRRATLREVNGFDARLIAGEEPELCRRIRMRGYKIIHTRQPMTGHDLAMTTPAQYWRRAVRAGYAYAQLADRSRDTKLPLWQDEVKGNRLRGGALLALLTGGLMGSFAMRSVWPMIFALLILAGLSLRTAGKVKWKSPDLLTRLLYGAHSHLQQAPILFGQLLFQRDQWRNTHRGLIEYK